ncbi:hypothetical protein T492DRAFT_855526 [Pavlovales sp. CCMP2436]|nr:hypothetical protein T492DRAFT_855526 [Pavlovales sp. CCMP2436]
MPCTHYMGWLRVSLWAAQKRAKSGGSGSARAFELDGGAGLGLIALELGGGLRGGEALGLIAPTMKRVANPYFAYACCCSVSCTVIILVFIFSPEAQRMLLACC